MSLAYGLCSILYVWSMLSGPVCTHANGPLSVIKKVSAQRMAVCDVIVYLKCSPNNPDRVITLDAESGLFLNCSG